MNHGSRVLLGIVVVAVVALGIWLILPESTVNIPEEPSPSVLEEPQKELSEDIVGERMADTNYVAVLRGLIGDRQDIIGKKSAVRKEMGSVLSNAASTLTDEELASTNKVTISGQDELPAPLYAQVEKRPEWIKLEEKMNELITEQENIQARTKTLIHERMSEQYAARTGTVTDSHHRRRPKVTPPDRQFIVTDQQTPMILTNAPKEGITLPPRPEREPVE